MSNQEKSNLEFNLESTQNNLLQEEDELIGDATFGAELSIQENDEYSARELNNEKNNKYTYIDHLDEDSIIENQRYVLFSFLSPEGIMNCNIRALKFRGAFPTLEQAKNYVDKLKQQDDYFKIFVGEQGKWMEFDPSEDKVEEEIADDPKAQEIINAQRKQRQQKINELAGRFKNQHDKNQSTTGKRERVDENIRASAAETEAQKRLSKRKEKKQNTAIDTGRGSQSNKLKERMRMKIQKRKEAEKLSREDNNVTGCVAKDDTNEKIKVVNKAIDELQNEKYQIDDVEEGINKIKNLMKKRD
jgi:hypothetical protein